MKFSEVEAAPTAAVLDNTHDMLKHAFLTARAAMAKASRGELTKEQAVFGVAMMDTIMGAIDAIEALEDAEDVEDEDDTFNQEDFPEDEEDDVDQLGARLREIPGMSDLIDEAQAELEDETAGDDQLVDAGPGLTPKPLWRTRSGGLLPDCTCEHCEITRREQEAARQEAEENVIHRAAMNPGITINEIGDDHRGC